MEERGNEKKDVQGKKSMHDDAIDFVNRITHRDSTKEDPSHHQDTTVTVDAKCTKNNGYKEKKRVDDHTNHSMSIKEENQKKRIKFRIKSFSNDTNSLSKGSDIDLHEQFFYKRSNTGNYEKKSKTFATCFQQDERRAEDRQERIS